MGNIKLTKAEIQLAVQELIEFSEEIDFDLGELKNFKHYPTFKQFLVERKLDEILDKLISIEIVDYKIDSIVFDEAGIEEFKRNELLLEWEQYKKIPKTRLIYRFDNENTNTLTQDHIHVLNGNNQLYAINKDGTPHDGSKARLGKKELKFLKSIGFTPPHDGILEWITLDRHKQYIAFKYYLLFD